jgi:hypothetical protein
MLCDLAAGVVGITLLWSFAETEAPYSPSRWRNGLRSIV